MKGVQNGNLAKLVAFFVIAITITCTVSFAANGWQSFIKDEPDSNDVVTDNNQNNDEIDENTDGDETNIDDEDITASIPEPKYYHTFTGLETDLETSLKKPMCTVFSSSDPMYGISSSYLTVEIPVEYGKTRLLCFQDDLGELGKIGSIAPTRGYISNIAAYLGATLLCYGNDDSEAFSYNSSMPNAVLDFSATTGYCYTEYNSFVYTNADLVNAFVNNSKVNLITTDAAKTPYLFNDIDADAILGTDSAKTVTISYSDKNSTTLSYSSADRKYILSKNGSSKNDLLNDKSSVYDNVFILYANSTTHETEESTQLVLDTVNGGKGKYISNGTMHDITWTKDASGSLVFLNENGEKLTINRGSSYISFVKSSMSDYVKIS